jgi:NAD(P)-dependent dehydrogenase (short-subunit alcohol dehydrogenase family)
MGPDPREIACKRQPTSVDRIIYLASKLGAVEKAVKLATNALGRLDVLANHAGFCFIGAIKDVTPDE